MTAQWAVRPATTEPAGETVYRADRREAYRAERSEAFFSAGSAGKKDIYSAG